ncbi:phage tail protein [Achromobacter kerstersii]
MAITALPIPPSRSDPANFPERADAFMAALPTFAHEANLLQAQVNEAVQTADENADSARGSAQAAAQSSNQAGDKANAASVAADLAGQRAAASTSAAALAAQWATKTGAPVSGDEFSAKHYAQQAAIGAGLPIYAANNVPQQNVGSIFIQGQGPAEWDSVTGRYRILSQIPVGSIEWWPLRTSIPAGKIPLDGQTISRATFPDIAAMVVAGTLPVVAEELWLSDPLQRGKYTLGDGSTTIRVPDYNGKSSGAIGALFLRGDGALSAGSDGLIQRDAFQGFRLGYPGATLGNFGINASGQNPGGLGIAAMRPDVTSQVGFVTDGANGTPRTAAETRPANVAGVWVVNAFGAVTNPGSVDAAQLASDLASLNAAFQALDGAIDSVIYYPNGSEAAPATIISNTRYVFPNPFPGYEVSVDVQIKSPDGSGTWFYPGWATTYVSAWQSHGTSVSQIGTGQLILQTGNTRVALAGSVGGGGGGEITSISSALVRLRVRKMKGYV